MAHYLKRCPFCGEEERIEVVDETKRFGIDMRNERGESWLTVLCYRCGATSKASQNASDVITAWGRREKDEPSVQMVHRKIKIIKEK